MSEIENIQINRRRNRALQLRLQGYKYSEIVTAVLLEFDVESYSIATAQNDINSALESENEQYRDNIQSLRIMEVQRLDLYLSKMIPKINEGDVQAINTALRVMDQRCRLLSLYPPQELRIRQGIDLGVADQLNLLFKAVHNDRSLSEDVKIRLYELASTIPDRATMVN